MSYLQVGLTAPNAYLYRRIDQRVLDRIAAGAAAENPVLAAHPVSWQNHEHSLARRQLTWFKKQPDINWFDISVSGWEKEALQLIKNWYNEPTNAPHC